MLFCSQSTASHFSPAISPLRQPTVDVHKQTSALFQLGDFHPALVAKPGQLIEIVADSFELFAQLPEAVKHNYLLSKRRPQNEVRQFQTSARCSFSYPPPLVLGAADGDRYISCSHFHHSFSFHDRGVRGSPRASKCGWRTAACDAGRYNISEGNINLSCLHSTGTDGRILV